MKLHYVRGVLFNLPIFYNEYLEDEPVVLKSFSYLVVDLDKNKWDKILASLLDSIELREGEDVRDFCEIEVHRVDELDGIIPVKLHPDASVWDFDPFPLRIEEG